MSRNPMWSDRLTYPRARTRLSFFSLLLASIAIGAVGRADYYQAAKAGADALMLQSAGPSHRSLGLGIDVLERDGFALLRGKRVGLLTHPAGVNRNGKSSVEILHRAQAVNLAALFGPEHGIYGDEKAEVPVLDKIDTRTGLPVYSLYGRYRKPTTEMLRGIDTLVIDLQDVGVRSYTYVSAMKLAIEACFENGKEVVVLDRPNPLGGLKVDGPGLEERWKSYVGAFEVPYVHGLTIGELARMSVSEPGILDVTEAQLQAGVLHVVTMDGWRRYMSWPQTGLRWVATSPYVPTFEAAVGYSMTGLGAQLGGFKHGIGSQYPFRLLRYNGVALDRLKAELESRSIPGIGFQRKNSTQGEGLYVNVTDWEAWRPTELSFHMMQISAKFESNNPFAAATDGKAQLFNKHVGSTSWWEQLARKGDQANVAGFVTHWQRQAKQFQIQSRRYWLYD